MLTQAEALWYLHDVLLVKNVCLDTRKERLQTLNEIILKQHEIPFQSLSLLEIPPDKRHRPTLAEIKEAVFTKTGGLCYTMNVFFFFLLKALGYDAFLNISTVITGKPNNHILVLVANVLEKGDMYLVEVGCSNPTLQAIGLGFTDESPLIKDSYLEYKFVKEDNRIKRLHALENKTPATEREDFQIFYEFELSLSNDVRDFDSYFDYIYGDMDAVLFHKVFVAKKFSKAQTTTLINFKLTVVREGEGTEKLELDCEDHVVSTAKEYFPQFDENMVRKALGNWKTTRNE